MAFGNGVIYAASIDLAAKAALDSRLTCATLAERDEHLTSNRAYPGMVVYVEENEKLYVLLDNTPTWVEVLSAENIINDLTTGGASSVLSAEQGKQLKAQIDSVASGSITVPVATDSKVGGILSGTGIGVVTVDGSGNASVAQVERATMLATARAIALTGDVTGTANFDGTADVTITATVADDSHNHVIDNVDGLQDALDLKAPLESPALTGTPTAPTADAGTSTTQLATTAFVQTAINNVLASSTALEFKGTVGTDAPLPGTAEVGDLYVVEQAGTYAEQVCEPGDMIICTEKEGPVWKVIQTNINGAVTGPASAVADHVATFDGATGKVIKDSGYTIAQNVPATSVWTIGEDVTDDAHGLMTPEQKTKLDGIAEGAEVNQNAVSTIVTQSGSAAASAKTDTLTINGANGVTTSASGKVITITGTTYADVEADGSESGLMTPADKAKLDGIAAGAEVNVNADWNAESGDAQILNKPTTMASPYAVTISAGAKSITYDGSETKTISIGSADVSAQPLFTGTAGNVAVVDEGGTASTDGGFSIASPVSGDIGKFLKVTGEGAYEPVGVTQTDVSGLTDSLNAKVQKVTTAVAGNMVQFAASGAIADSGVAASTLLSINDTIIFQCSLD